MDLLLNCPQGALYSVLFFVIITSFASFIYLLIIDSFYGL